MNPDQNNPFNLVSENSETDLKRDSRLAVLDRRFGAGGGVRNINALRRERAVNLELAGEWSGDPFKYLRAAMAPGMSIGLMDQRDSANNPTVKPRVVTPDLTGEVQAMLDEDSAYRAARAAERLGVAVRLTVSSLAVLAAIEAVGSARRADIIVVDDMHECHPWRMAAPVEPSLHPGERHRQVSRQLTSFRSRAGKAGRWS